MPPAYRSPARPHRPRRATRAGALALAGLLALAGCGGTDEEDAPSTRGSDGVEVTGAAGEEPTIAVPVDPAPTELASDVLVEGDGPTVATGDLLVVDYKGVTWPAEGGGDDSKQFDASWTRPAPSAFPIGQGSVVEAWDDVLVGKKVGSRVLIVAPPDTAYGEEGQPSAGIEGDTTLVFVVDVLASYGADARTTGTPTGTTGLGGVTVTGEVSQRPTLTVPAGTAPPTAVTSAKVVQGDGDVVVGPASVTTNVEIVGWDPAADRAQSTWGGTPQALSYGDADNQSLLDELGIADVRVGDRYLVLLPAQAGGDPATDSFAAVVDVVGSVVREGGTPSGTPNDEES